MAIFTENGIRNTAEDEKFVNEWLERQKKVTIKERSTDKTLGIVPIVRMMSDYNWQLKCLNDRINNPEKYRAFENVELAIERLTKWLKEHNEEAFEEDEPLPDVLYVNSFTAL